MNRLPDGSEPLTNPDDEPAILAAAEANLCAVFASMRDWPRAVVRERDEAFSTLTDVPFPLLNSVMRARFPSGEAADAGIAALLWEGRERGVPLMWWADPLSRPDDLARRLEARGFSLGEPYLLMAADLTWLRDGAAEAPAGLTVEEVTRGDSLCVYGETLCRAFDLPDFVAGPIAEWMAYALPGRYGMRLFIGRHDGRPVATAALVAAAGVAGVYNVGTVPEARGRGIGSYLTGCALRAGRAAGGHISVLYATKMGEGVYRRLGFREYGPGGSYVWAGGAAGD
jgi:ribosomal protein S18 acetylase RimI-like enzyme